MKVYRLKVAAGSEAAAAAALFSLEQLVKNVTGCRSAQAFCEEDAAQQLTFIEEWDSDEAYTAAKTRLPPEAFKTLIMTLAEPPAVSILRPVEVAVTS